ncbi:RDD family protein [Salipaludibacillus daqingensis]|uniref:RDD family protein n=1 Tax=Salipaludibacillus daqingensis TaxID=3041001 RepID=UPI00247457FF|nr:RDD family protein [Salipaludibacillus daqingensis]
MNNENEWMDTSEQSLNTETPNSPYVTIPYAGFWMRVWAYLVDLIIVSSLSGILLVPLYFAMNVDEWTLGIFTVAGIVANLVAFGYFSLMTKYFQQTLGKQIFGLKVYSYTDGAKLTWLDVIFRELVGRYIHQSLVITNILYVVVAFSSEKRGIHDRLGQTFVGLEPRKGKSIPKEQQ